MMEKNRIYGITLDSLGGVESVNTSRTGGCEQKGL
jgi:hypothetical protein